ncbi:MAG: hypothetical protein WC529_04110 [Candidatus Margulisiibacteriota bacterium]
MMKRSALVLLGLMVLAFAAAAVPQYVNYQGLLRDSGGLLINGNKAMVFKLYDAETAGNLLWTMTSAEVKVSGGIYFVQLGPLTASELGAGRRWLELAVGGETLSPRMEILSVAYAVTADNAATAGTANYAALSGSASTAAYATTTGNVDYSTLSGSASTAAYATTTGNVDYSTLSGSASTAAYATTTGNVDYAALSGTATNAGYAILTGTATNAGMVDNFSASSTEAIAGQLLALDGSKRLKGLAVSAEASGTNNALYILAGKIGVQAGANMSAGNNTVPSGTAGITVTNNKVTASSIILLMVGESDENTDEALKVSQINDGVSFVVKTVDGTAGASIPFRYLIIN